MIYTNAGGNEKMPRRYRIMQDGRRFAKCTSQMTWDNSDKIPELKRENNGRLDRLMPM